LCSFEEEFVHTLSFSPLVCHLPSLPVFWMALVEATKTNQGLKCIQHRFFSLGEC